MKMGIRKPNYKSRIRARTTGKMKRKIKKATIPGYGKKGTGWVKNPKKAAYNKVYNKTTISTSSLMSNSRKKTKKPTRSSVRPVTKNRQPSSAEYSTSASFMLFLAILTTIIGFTTYPILLLLAVFFFILAFAMKNQSVSLAASDSSLTDEPAVSNSANNFLDAPDASEEKIEAYYRTLQVIEETWSVLLKENAFSTAKGDDYIKLCRQNINELDELLKITNRPAPPLIPAYKRLAMLYEKRRNYEEAIFVCQEAISKGITGDGTKGGMEGRIERLKGKQSKYF